MFFAISVWLCSADLPVHCEHHQVVGDWQFTTGTFLKNGEPDPNCGFTAPDDPYGHGDMMPQRVNSSAVKPPSNFRVESTFNLRMGQTWNVDASASGTGSPPPFSNTQGKWTMIYDEAFHVSFPDPAKGNHDFLAFMWYSTDKNRAPLSASTDNAAHSVCGQTLVGWYRARDPELPGGLRTTSREQKCFYGVQLKNTGLSALHNDTQSGQRKPTPATLQQMPEGVRSLASKAGVAAASLAQMGAYRPGHKWKRKFVPHVALPPAERPRHRSLLQRQDADTGRTSDGYGSGFGQLMGRQEARTKDANADLNAERTYLYNVIMNGTPDDDGWRWTGWKPGGHRAESFDWRTQEIGGVQGFVGRGVQQECGTCYAVATASSIVSRLWMRHPSLKAEWTQGDRDRRASVDYIKGCDYYNQGCDGGYPYMVAYQAHEHWWPTEKCYKSNGTCSQQCEEMLRAKNFYYVGGAYGRCGAYNLCEEMMREEIYRGGPIPCSVEPSGQFGAYGADGTAATGLQDVAAGEACPEGKECYNWQKVDHSILCVGWGVDKQVGQPDKKYWLVQNSWGPQWGQNSFGKVERGVNALFIETDAVAIVPEYIKCAGGECRAVPPESGSAQVVRSL